MHDGYRKHRERAAQRQREQSTAGRDIGELPKVRRPARKRRGKESLRYFCEKYFPERFTLKWSADHLRVLAKIETAVRDGGLFALAMPRGSGKTTIVECAVLWAILYGFRSFVAVIGSDETSALELLESIKVELECSDLLLEDFPKVCFPIRALDGVPQRAGGQTYLGVRTRIGWKGKTLILPTIRNSAGSAAIVQARGITGRIRGMKFTRPDGRSVRPDLVIPDDPQTDESARSPQQCHDREKVLSGAILGLAGPAKAIAGVMPCTVIRHGDMAHNLLNREKHPAWQGETMRMVYAWPSNQDLWDRYAEIRAEELANDRTIAKATAFYRRNRKRMDAGAVVAWPERKNDDELSALQHAVNLRLRDVDTFDAEYQNDPPDDSADMTLLSVDQIAAKTNGYARDVVPADASHVTAFIDVQGELLYWLVAAWSDEFTGYVVDYGSWPEQRQRYFSLSGARHTLSRRYRGAGLEGRIRAGLDELIGELAGRRLRRDDAAEMPIERILIDANWGESTDVVYQAIRQSPQRALLLPTHGRAVMAGQKPMQQWAKKPGELVGLQWRLRRTTGSRAAVRHGIYDTNFWKSFVHARLAVALGDRGCLSLFKAKVKTEHRMLAEHLRAEDRTRVSAAGAEVDQWKLKPGRPDNHLLDCLVGAAVAASMCGCALAEHAAARRPRKRSKGVRYLE